ncbi:MAG: AAA family ATPase, partial [Deltaproteobacteria bacterium]|nr:AAA family ATPase [Deltaproteobacteria bacterium]
FPVLVVSRTGLGAVNHSLLTLDRLRRENLKTVGLVANHFSSRPGIAEREFISQLREFDPVEIIGELPLQESPPVSDREWDDLARHLDIDSLIRLISDSR